MKRQALAGLVLIAGMATAVLAQARDLTVVAWGGTTQAAQRKLFYEPFMKTAGLKLLWV